MIIRKIGLAFLVFSVSFAASVHLVHGAKWDVRYTEHVPVNRVTHLIKTLIFSSNGIASSYIELVDSSKRESTKIEVFSNQVFASEFYCENVINSDEFKIFLSDSPGEKNLNKNRRIMVLTNTPTKMYLFNASRDEIEDNPKLKIGFQLMDSFFENVLRGYDFTSVVEKND